MRTFQKALLISLGLIGVGIVAPVVASASSDITLDVAPPPPRAEAVPGPRAGYVWAPGHWEWSGRFYTWVAGTWIVAHGSYHWSAARWEQVGDRWHFVQGKWDK